MRSTLAIRSRERLLAQSRQLTPERRLEAHLLGFEGDLYGKEVEVAFVEFIRPEEKFPTLDRLKARIAQDLEAARILLAA